MLCVSVRVFDFMVRDLDSQHTFCQQYEVTKQNCIYVIRCELFHGSIALFIILSLGKISFFDRCNCSIVPEPFHGALAFDL